MDITQPPKKSYGSNKYGKSSKLDTPSSPPEWLGKKPLKNILKRKNKKSS